MVRALVEDMLEVLCLAAFLAGLATLAQPGVATLIG